MPLETISVAVNPETVKHVEQIAEREGWTDAAGDANMSHAIRQLVESGLEEYEG